MSPVDSGPPRERRLQPELEPPRLATPPRPTTRSSLFLLRFDLAAARAGI